MAAVSESIVREYFEMHGFFVRQQRKFIARIQAEDDEINRNYQKADLLQIIRILKNYDFFKENQLELFKGKRKAAGARKAG